MSASNWYRVFKGIAVFIFVLITVFPAKAEVSLDTTFNGTGYVTHNTDGSATSGTAVAIDSDGRMVVSGSILGPGVTASIALWRFNVDGTLDTSFAGTGYVTNTVIDCAFGSDVAIDSKGRILVAGHARFICDQTGNDNMFVLRYNPDGTLDTSFYNSILPMSPSHAYAIAVDDQDRVLVAGEVMAHSIVMRVNENGSLDSGFGPYGTYYLNTNPSMAGDILVDGSGHILFSELDGVGHSVRRLNSDGMLDTTFGTNGISGPFPKSGLFDLILGSNHSLALDSGGGIIVSVGGVRRLNPDGSLDSSFNNNTGYVAAWGGTLDASGRIIVLNDGALYRLNPDGTPDNSFNGGQSYIDFYGTVLPLGVTGVALDRSNRLVLAGEVKYIVREMGGLRYVTDESVTDIQVADSEGIDDDLAIDYGTVTVGSSAVHTVTVKNIGATPLQVGTVALSNTTAGFSITQDGCSSTAVEPMMNCSVEVQFSPAAVGDFTSTLDIPSNDPDEGVVSVSLSGTGAVVPVPDITVTDTMFPHDDMKVPFYSVVEGEASDSVTIRISNTGTGLLSVSDVQLSGLDAQDFTVDLSQPVLDCLASIDIGSSCTIDVTFTPLTPGAKTASITMTTNDPDLSTASILLSGIGAPQEANVPPKQPQLLFPGNVSDGHGNTVKLKWNASEDPDGDTVTYQVYISNTPDFQMAQTMIPDEPGGYGKAFAGGVAGLGFIVFGLLLSGDLGRRRKFVLLMAALLMIGLMMVSCGSLGADNKKKNPQATVSQEVTALDQGTTYYWKIRADDGRGGIADSETWTFTTAAE